MNYRHKSIHNGGLLSNCFITTEGDKFLEKEKDSEDWTLNISKMHQIVEKCYEKLKGHLLEFENMDSLESLMGESTNDIGDTINWNCNAHRTGYTQDIR